MQSRETDVFNLFSEIYSSETQEEMSLQQYLLACRDNRSVLNHRLPGCSRARARNTRPERLSQQTRMRS